jgi:hypothetical protein
MREPGFRNLSDLFRELSCKTTGIFREVGGNVVDIFESEFEQLVMETPQWTGTTAASWKISLGGRGVFGGDSGVHTLPKRSREQALWRGHMKAVNLALTANAGNFENMRERLSREFATAAITIDNQAPGSTQAEKGPVRVPENVEPHALDRYIVRVASKIESSRLVDPNYFSKYNTKC